MQKPKCSFPPIQGVVMDKSYPLITRACQLWQRLHGYSHDETPLQRRRIPRNKRVGTLCQLLVTSFLPAERVFRGATRVLSGRAKPQYSMVGTKGILPFTFHIAFWRDPSAEYRSPARLGDGGHLSPHRSFYCHTTYITYTSLVSTLVPVGGFEPSTP